jgi:uncharacterized membrane protein
MKGVEKMKGFQGLVFGIVDGLIAVIGTTFAISALEQKSFYILISGLAVALSNGIANSVGFYLSEEVESEQKIANHTRKEIFKAGFLCFFRSHFFLFFITFTIFVFRS